MGTGRWSREESVALLRRVRVMARAAEAFEDFDLGLDWLNSPNSALEGARPMSLLANDSGVESVIHLLGRIEHGVFS